MNDLPFIDLPTLAWINGVLGIAAGLLVLTRPASLQYAVSGYLLLTALFGFYSGAPLIWTILPISAAGLIMVFPKLGPSIFATYLIGFCLLGVFGGGTASLMILPGLIAVSMLAIPDLLSYSVAVYMILSGLSYMRF